MPPRQQTDKSSQPIKTVRTSPKSRQVNPKPRTYSKPRSKAKTRSSLPVLFAISFLGLLTAACYWHFFPLVITGLYLGLSLMTFIVYALDKSAAKRGNWRTQERTLHLLSLFGGWPGALMAQNLLRHKSVKTSFRTRFWLSVVVNLALLSYGIQSGQIHRFI
ncbi:DUF1294 domain-containing protein [Shewanella sp. A25]|nr:DUF1294 domain-containing protein [Shewanella shenzhenensis]